MMKTLHPELVEGYLRQFGAELSFLRGIDLPVPSADRHLVVQRIVEGEDPAPRHFPIPCLARVPRVKMCAYPRGKNRRGLCKNGSNMRIWKSLPHMHSFR